MSYIISIQFAEHDLRFFLFALRLIIGVQVPEKKLPKFPQKLPKPPKETTSLMLNLMTEDGKYLAKTFLIDILWLK